MTDLTIPAVAIGCVALGMNSKFQGAAKKTARIARAGTKAVTTEFRTSQPQADVVDEGGSLHRLKQQAV